MSNVYQVPTKGWLIRNKKTKILHDPEAVPVPYKLATSNELLDSWEWVEVETFYKHTGRTTTGKSAIIEPLFKDKD